jgi:hypothetical protein
MIAHKKDSQLATKAGRTSAAMSSATDTVVAMKTSTKTDAGTTKTTSIQGSNNRNDLLHDQNHLLSEAGHHLDDQNHLSDHLQEEVADTNGKTCRASNLKATVTPGVMKVVGKKSLGMGLVGTAIDAEKNLSALAVADDKSLAPRVVVMATVSRTSSVPVQKIMVENLPTSVVLVVDNKMSTSPSLNPREAMVARKKIKAMAVVVTVRAMRRISTMAATEGEDIELLAVTRPEATRLRPDAGNRPTRGQLV